MADDTGPLEESSPNLSKFKVDKVAYKSPSQDKDDNVKFFMSNNELDQQETDDHLLSPMTQHPSGKKARPIRISTQEALPHEDHYRNLFSATHHLKERPTLEQLHGTPENLFVQMTDVELGGETNTDNDTLGLTETVIDGKKKKQVKFGWIQGVLVRCLLNIWGVMLFIRLPWVVGQAGIGFASVIILLSSTVTTITALSMSAICTNGVVRGGGTYYLISRSLGPEFGSSVGVVFSFANAGAVAMHLVGFAETVRDVMYAHGARMIDSINDLRIIGYLALILCVCIIIMGMEWEAKAQNVLLVILLTAIADFYAGTFMPPSEEKMAKGFMGWKGSLFLENFPPAFTEGESFFSIFSVFFPSTTGILAGANISGDLKDPQMAIPRGTLLAILITTSTYLAMCWTSALVAVRYAAGPIIVEAVNQTVASVTSTMNTEAMITTQATLMDGVTDQSGNFDFTAQLEARNNICRSVGNCTSGLLMSYQMIEMISGFGPLITAGIFAATLSSALACFVSGPKVFQAVCNDKVFSFLYMFGKGYGKNNEPVRSYALCFIIAAGFITIGELNVIAMFISNFFMMAYALVNYSCFDASLVKSPGWRPSFRYYSMWVSLLGFFICVIIMFVMNWWIALLTFILVAILYFYVHYSKPDVNWGSSMQARVYRNALQYTMKLVRVEDHIKNYRPQILVLSGFPSQRPALIDFVYTIAKKQSLMSCGHVIVTDTGMKHLDNYQRNAYEFLEKRRTKAFYSVVSAPSIRVGAQALLQTVGLGKLRPNLLMMGFKPDWQIATLEDIDEYVDIIHDAFDLRYGVGVLRIPEGLSRGDVDTESQIDASSMRTGSTLQLEKGGYYNKAMEMSEKDKASYSSHDAGSSSTRDLQYNTSFVSSVDLGRHTQLEEEMLPDYSSTLNLKQLFRHKSSTTEFPTRFSKKQLDGTMDVYWMFDDGGLTLLLPYILAQRRLWNNTKIRVFTKASANKQLDSDQQHMASLLSKFRIDYHAVTILPDADNEPTTSSKESFEKLIDPFVLQEDLGETEESHPGKISQSYLESNALKTSRHLRLKEILLEHSFAANLIVLTLPIPRKSTTPPSLYMAWLETLTSGLPPILLLRGNQQSVLTYYS